VPFCSPELLQQLTVSCLLGLHSYLLKHNKSVLLDAIVSTEVLAGCHPEKHLWHIFCSLRENFHTVIVKFLVPERVFIKTVSCILLGCVAVRATGEAGP